MSDEYDSYSKWLDALDDLKKLHQENEELRRNMVKCLCCGSLLEKQFEYWVCTRCRSCFELTERK